jgi:hypothetical protein
MISVVSLKFVEKVQMLLRDSSRMQIPLLSPFFKRGNLLRRILTTLWQRGEGEIFGQSDERVIQ